MSGQLFQVQSSWQILWNLRAIIWDLLTLGCLMATNEENYLSINEWMSILSSLLSNWLLATIREAKGKQQNITFRKNVPKHVYCMWNPSNMNVIYVTIRRMTFLKKLNIVLPTRSSCLASGIFKLFRFIISFVDCFGKYRKKQKPWTFLLNMHSLAHIFQFGWDNLSFAKNSTKHFHMEHRFLWCKLN